MPTKGKIHAVCGLPRSGSTLLCNLLNQNPAFHASSTSGLAQTVGAMMQVWSGQAETKSDLAHDRDGTEARMQRVVQAVMEAWYGGVDAEVVFDKGRGWVTLQAQMLAIMPEMRLICVVRDPREVLASVERHHAAFPVLSDVPPGDTMLARADRLFSPQGLIGGPLTHMEDLHRRDTPNVVVVKYEALVARPEREMAKLYADLGLEAFGHDFDAVEDTATDLDALYLNKFPHQGAGGTVAPRPVTWPTTVPGEIATLIANRYNTFFRAFGYA